MSIVVLTIFGPDPQGDYLSAEQRRLWSKYFDEKGWDHVFFSAHLEQAKLDKAAAAQHRAEDSEEEDLPEPEHEVEPVEGDPGRLLTRKELTQYMLDFAKRNGCEPNPRYDNRFQFGTVGFPNVG